MEPLIASCYSIRTELPSDSAKLRQGSGGYLCKVQAFGWKGRALWAPTAGVHLTLPSSPPPAHPFPHCPAPPLPFQELGTGGWERSPGQAELNEKEAGGRGLHNDRRIPPMVWPGPLSVLEGEMLGKPGVAECSRQNSSPWWSKDTHILMHRTHDFAMFCGNKGPSLLISLI